MDFILGLIAGILLTVVLGAAVIWFLLRKSQPPVLPPTTPLVPGVPFMVTALSENLINRVLAETIDVNAAPVPVRGPFKFKLNRIHMHIQPGRRSQITVDILVTAGPLKITLYPSTEILLEHLAGRVRIIVVTVQVAGISIPRELVDRFVQDIVRDAEAKMNTVLEQLQTQLSITLFDLQTNEQEMLLKFK